MKMKRHGNSMFYFWWLFCALFLVVSADASGQTHPKIKNIGIEKPKTILYIGNSFFYFNDSMHRYVSGLTTAADPENKGQYRSTSITISGSGLGYSNRILSRLGWDAR
jgi:hypothetical protein